MAPEAETFSPAPADLWRHVEARDEWLKDLSALVVEVNDGQPYCIVPSYSSYLMRSSNSFIADLARRGDTSGSRAEVARDVLRRLIGTGLVFSRVKNAALRSAVPEALWRLTRWITTDLAALKKSAEGIARRLAECGIPLNPGPSSYVIASEDPGKAPTCDYHVWITCMASWLVFYMQDPTQEKLFGTDRMVDAEEVDEARNALQELSEGIDNLQFQPRKKPNEFDSKEVAYILGISPLAATCLWSMIVIGCNGPLIGISQDAREGVILKYSLGKLLLFSKGTLYQVTREFGKDISRIYSIRRTPSPSASSVSVTEASQTCKRSQYQENRRKTVSRLPTVPGYKEIEAIECKYLIDCCRENENISMSPITDASLLFQSFRSLATLSAFQIDIAQISRTHDGRWHTMLLNRPLSVEENDLTKVYRSMLRKARITPDALISGVSKLTAFLVWMAVIVSLGLGVYAGARTNASWEDRIDSVVKVSGPVFLILVVAEYLSPHEHYVKVLLTSTIEIKKMSSLARFLGLSYNETLWLVATDPRVKRLLHNHGTGFLRDIATGPLVLDGISRPRETIGHTCVWGEKFVVDEIGVRVLKGQTEEILHVEKCVEPTGNGLVVISLEGSKEIRGATPTD